MIKEFLNTDRVSLKIGKALSHLPVTPNQWTAISVLPAIAGFLAVVYGHALWGTLLFALAGVVDGFDGGLARYTHRSTKLGAFLDGNTDRFVDFLVVYSFLFLGLPDRWLPLEHWVVIMMFLAVLPSFTVAYSNHRGAVPDPTERIIWRILNRPEMYTLFLLVLVTAPLSADISLSLLILTVVLSFITTLHTKFLTIVKAKHYNTHLQ